VGRTSEATRSSQRTALAAALLAVLLALVATLQYRWTGELGRAAEERARAGLGRAAAAFATELDREMARVLFAFHGPPVGDPAAAVGERLRAWRESEPQPDLLRDAFLVRQGGGGEPVVERWDEALGRAVPAEWPAELQPMATSLAIPPRDGLRRRVGPWPDVPALVVPLAMSNVAMRRHLGEAHGVDEGHRGHRGNRGSREDGEGMAVDDVELAALVLWLDERVLREELLPELGERYFAGDVAYRVEVRDANGRLVWSQGPPVEGGPPDAAAALFTLGTFERPRWPGGAGPGDPQSRLPRLGPPARAAEPHERSWHLAVTHPAGSLATAMARARWRQLALSFVVLALLGGAAAMLLLAARRAEALARRQVELVAGVSHELLTPVAALRSAGENLAAGLVTDPEQVRRYGDLVEREGRRLGSLVEQVLTWAGLQARGVAAERREVEPAALVAAVVATCAAEAAAAGVTLESHVAAGLPPLFGEPDALERALRNLVENGLRHGAAGGWVAVGAEASAGRRGRPEVALFVEDRGPGLAAEELPHLHEPFFRGRQARTGGVAGSGLGLALVRQIVEAHGGRVRASQATPQGARFTLELPAASRDALAPGGVEETGEPTSTTTRRGEPHRAQT
jgi:signal transduction histidine kinase